MRILRKVEIREEGQTLVEFALLLPILLALIVAVIDFGWVFMAKLSITNSAREAVRYYAVNKVDIIDVQSKAQETMKMISSKNLLVTVKNINPNNDLERMAYVKINASVEPLIGFVYSDNIDIASEAFMRFEYGP